MLKHRLALRFSVVSLNRFPVLVLLCSLRAESVLGAVWIVGLSEGELRFCLQLVVKHIWLRIKGGSSVFGALPFPDQMLDVLG